MRPECLYDSGMSYDPTIDHRTDQQIQAEADYYTARDQANQIYDNHGYGYGDDE